MAQNGRDKEVSNAVDTIPWIKRLVGRGILNCTLGAVNRRHANADMLRPAHEYCNSISLLSV
jgi:hypothetical protein